MKPFGLVLFEKPFESGLTRKDIPELLSKTPEDSEVYPIEIMATQQECSAMGFITRETADLLDFDYEKSGLNNFIADILDDLNKETETNTYEFKGIKIFMGYSNN